MNFIIVGEPGAQPHLLFQLEGQVKHGASVKVPILPQRVRQLPQAVVLGRLQGGN